MKEIITLSLRKLIRESMNSHIVTNKDCIQNILLLTYLDVEMGGEVKLD